MRDDLSAARADACPVERASVSAVIPTRGRPEVVLRAVASALEQTLPVVEVVVVVDGPDDATVRALAALGEPRLRVVALPRSRGAAGARNEGIRVATGDWIALLDDDDVWLPTKVERQWAVLSAAPAPARTVAATAAYWETDAGDLVWPRRAIAAGERLADYLFVRTYPGEGLMATPTLMLPTALARSLPMPEHLTIHEDHDWLLGLEGRGVGFVVLTEPLARVDGGAGRSSASRDARWEQSLAWARSRRSSLGPRAYSAFVLTEVGRAAARERRVRTSLRVLRAGLRGRPRLRDLARFAVIQSVPEETRWRLGDRLGRLMGQLSGRLSGRRR